MRPQALTHIVAAARALIRGESIIVVGSSALLARFPDLGETGRPLEASFDVEIIRERLANTAMPDALRAHCGLRLETVLEMAAQRRQAARKSAGEHM